MKKLYVIIPLILVIAVVAFWPKSQGLSVTYASVPEPQEEHNKTVLKVFLENSGSMDGYMCDGSELKDAVKGFTSSLESAFDSLSLNFINSTIIPRGNDIRDFTVNMNPEQFKMAGGSRANTDVGELIDKVVRNTPANTVSMFISDCILDIPAGRSTDFFTDRQIDVTNSIKWFIRKGHNAVVVIQLESKFAGSYYAQDGVTQLEGEKRPYYIWLFGDADLISKAIKDNPIEDIKHGIKNWASFNCEQVIPFEVVNKYGGKPQKIQAMGDDYQINIKADLSRLLKSESLLTDVRNYSTGHGNSIKISKIQRKDDKNFTHMISLDINKGIASCEDVLTYSEANKVPSWVEASNDDSGTNIKNNISKTTGIKYLVQGIADAYKTTTELGEIRYVLNNK